MKAVNTTLPGIFNKLALAICSLILTVAVFAQEGGTDLNVKVDTDSGNGFMGSPLMWVIGAAVFILLLVALLRGGRKSDA